MGRWHAGSRKWSFKFAHLSVGHESGEWVACMQVEGVGSRDNQLFLALCNQPGGQRRAAHACDGEGGGCVLLLAARPVK